MMRRCLLSFMAIGCLVAAAPVLAPTEGDEAAIRAVVSGFEEGWNRHEARKMMAAYADSADFVNWLGMWWTGRSEIERQHAVLHASNMKDSRLTVRWTRIRFLRPDVAVARVRWDLVGGKNRQGKPTGARTGLLIHVLTKENGMWMIHATQNTDVVTVSQPPSGAK